MLQVNLKKVLTWVSAFLCQRKKIEGRCKKSDKHNKLNEAERDIGNHKILIATVTNDTVFITAVFGWF